MVMERWTLWPTARCWYCYCCCCCCCCMGPVREQTVGVGGGQWRGAVAVAPGLVAEAVGHANAVAFCLSVSVGCIGTHLHAHVGSHHVPCTRLLLDSISSGGLRTCLPCCRPACLSACVWELLPLSHALSPRLAPTPKSRSGCI